MLELKSLSQTFNYADKRLVDVLKEKVELEKEIEKNNKSIFLKIFQNSLYQERKVNLNNSLHRANEVLEIFGANPNRVNELNITLREILDRSIENTKKHLTSEEIEKISSNSYAFGVGIDSVKFKPNMESIYFNEQPKPKQYPKRTPIYKGNTKNIEKNKDDQFTR